MSPSTNRRPEIAAVKKWIEDDFHKKGLDPMAEGLPVPQQKATRSRAKRKPIEDSPSREPKRRRADRNEGTPRVKGHTVSKKSSPAVDDPKKNSLVGATKEQQTVHGDNGGAQEDAADQGAFAAQGVASLIPPSIEVTDVSLTHQATFANAADVRQVIDSKQVDTIPSTKQAQKDLFTKASTIADLDGLVVFAARMKKQQQRYATKQQDVRQILHLADAVFAAVAESTKAASLAAALLPIDRIEHAICYSEAFVAIHVLERGVATFEDLPSLHQKVKTYLEASEDHVSKSREKEQTAKQALRLTNHKTRHGSLLLLMAMIKEQELIGEGDGDGHEGGDEDDA